MPDLKPDHLIVRYLSHEATPAEQEKLFEWVSRSKENQRIFNEYVNLWSNTDKSGSTFNIERATRKLNVRIEEFEATEKKKTVFWNRWSIAAAILLLMVSGFVLFQSDIFTPHESVQSLMRELKSGDSTVRVTLPDGSIITLNKDAALNYPEAFVAGTREVYLSGEAFFQIAKDPARPFIIHTNDMTTTVVGTSFNVRSAPGEVVVSVATGKVKVSNGRQTEILLPNEKMIYKEQSFKKESTNLAELNWMNRTLVFEDTSLEDAAKLIEEHFDVTVSFQHSALKKCQITGTFKNQSLETVLGAIAFSNDVKYEILNDTVTLTGTGCK